MKTNKNQSGNTLILVVDDDDGLCNLITRQLKRKGYDICTASCGKEAVEITRQDTPDLMLLDYRLPDMTGPEVISAITEQGSLPPFIMMTGQGDERLAVDIMKLGAVDYLIKDTDLVDRIPVVVARELKTVKMSRQLAKTEAALAESQRLDSIGRLAGGVAHDFNNMLGGIMGAVQILQMHLPNDDAKSKKFLSLILDSVDRASDLAKNLLAFSSRQTSASTTIDIHNAISNAISLLKTTIDKRIEIEVDLCAKTSIVVGDISQLQNVFLNMGINASHAMPEGGILSFRSKNIALSEAYCKSSVFDITPGNYIEFEVQDNGCGISFENQSKIFEPFFTTKEQGKGTGLGLAAAYGTVKQHKGEITVYSEVGKGTNFHLLFPITNTEATQILPPIDSIHGKGLILLVDDEMIMRTTGEAILQELGYRVILAENGSQAFNIFRERSEEIDLVLIDMIMPVMNGRDCFFALKKIQPGIPIVLASGFSRNEDLIDLEKQGLSGFIQKPYRGSELSHIVAKVLDNIKDER